MRILFFVLFSLFGVLPAHAAVKCGGNLHPKDKAECLLKDLIATSANKEIQSQVVSFEAAGLSASTEATSVFVGGGCNLTGKCTWKYMVSSDFYRPATFKSVAALIEASNDQSEPILRRVLSQKEL